MIFFFLLIIFSTPLAFADIITDTDFGFSLDIPEGFELADSSSDGFSYMFTHPNIPVTLTIKIYYDSDYKDSKDALEKTFSKLSAKSESDTFKWQGKTSAISPLSFTLEKAYKGWSLCSPTKIQNSYVCLLCYCPAEKFEGCQQFIMSTLNSLCINSDEYYTPGPVVTYAFPKTGKKAINCNIDGTKITSSIDSSDGEAGAFIVDLEYSVLKLYASHKLWKEAWERYYRLIYRDNFGRIKSFLNDTYEKLYPIAEKENPQNPPLAYAQHILNWVQTFNYQRAKTGAESDFTSLPEILLGSGNDCDSRSMLVSAMLNSIGTPSIILISREYSHSMVAADLNAPGQTISIESTDEKGRKIKREYLFGETTAKVTWGKIAQDMTDRTKWIPMKF